MLESLLMATAGVLPAFNLHSQQSLTNQDKPNIIILLVDDLGWKDVGFMGSKYFETPNLDRLAGQSMVFNCAYAACAVSSPTRASIMTGRYPARIGVTDWIRARFQLNSDELQAPEPFEENEGKQLRTPSNPYWMGLDEVTIAEVLKKSGYFTCHIGKWHLGTDDYYPEKQGFDLNIAGCDMGQPVNYFDPYRNEKGVGFPDFKPRMEGEYLTDRLADELVNVIKNHHDDHFFISMCYYAVHTPLMAKQKIEEKYRQKNPVDGQTNPVYAAMIETLDNAVGKLLDILKKEKILENTMIFFLSDNGGLIGSTDNTPLRSGKGYPYEGGIRIPMFVYWNGVIKPESVCSLPVSTIDIFPTICSIIGSMLPDKPIDGRDISPVFKGKNIQQVPLYWHFPHYRGNDVVPYSIIRDGDWKLIKRYEGNEFELYDLHNDIGEQKNMVNENPAKVKELNDKLREWLIHTNAKIPIRKN
jgi:arylsulfatase A